MKKEVASFSSIWSWGAQMGFVILDGLLLRKQCEIGADSCKVRVQPSREGFQPGFINNKVPATPVQARFDTLNRLGQCHLLAGPAKRVGKSQPEIAGSRHQVRCVTLTIRLAKLVVVFGELVKSPASGSAPDFESGDVSWTVFGQQEVCHWISVEQSVRLQLSKLWATAENSVASGILPHGTKLLAEYCVVPDSGNQVHLGNSCE
ncbi:MAG TPA: hypothetical protein VKU02_11070 [Gemmataceae bacterium]|nr:hypothetical protein [Gemmataceae bacterium]